MKGGMDDNYDDQWCAGVTLVKGENQAVTKRQREYFGEAVNDVSTNN